MLGRAGGAGAARGGHRAGRALQPDGAATRQCGFSHVCVALVAKIDRGFQITQRLGRDAAFISAGGYHHHIGLNTWESEGGSPPPPGTTGLFHLAIRYPDRATLADALRRLQRAGIPLDGASDHGVSEALYLHDPDHNGVELYRDRPQVEWPRSPSGEAAMFTRRLDLDSLLAEKS